MPRASRCHARSPRCSRTTRRRREACASRRRCSPTSAASRSSAPRADRVVPRIPLAPRIELPQVLRLGLFLGGSILAATVFLLAHWAIERLSREVATTSRVLAQFCAQASFPATRSGEIGEVVGELIPNIDFPILL